MKILSPQLLKIVFLALTLCCQTLRAQNLYTVSPLTFNTKDYDEFSAVPYKDGLVFCSNRIHNIFIARLDSLDRPLLDLYFVRKKENQKWGIPELFGKELNGPFHEGPMTFGKNGTVIYYTRNDAEMDGIFSAVIDGSTWGKITPFPYNEANSKTAHPCLSADGKKLFFVSDRHGGYGGFDIYVCTMNHNQWSRPKNLGPEINTADDELYPFYHNSGKLYFASKRPGGYGDMDIYYSKELNGKWMAPIHLDPPINTKYNDFAFWSDSTDRHGYLSSDRNSRNGLTDIFELTMNFPALSENICEPQKKNTYTYIFFEQSSVNTDTTTYKYEWDFGDGNKHRGKELEIEHTFTGPGDYIVQLNVIDTLTGEIYLNQATSLFPVRNIEQPFITCQDTAFVGQDILFDASKTYLPEVKNANYYWDFDDGFITEGKQVNHKFQEPGVYNIILGVTGLDAKKRQVTLCRSRQIIVKNISSQ